MKHDAHPDLVWTKEDSKKANAFVGLGFVFVIGWITTLLIILAPSGCPNKKTPEYYYLLGKNQVLQGDNLGAIESFSKAIKYKPDYLEAYGERAQTWIKEDSFNRAIDDYTKLIELKPSGDFYYLRGMSYWKSASDRDTLACADWRKARDLNNLKSWDMIRKYCK